MKECNRCHQIKPLSGFIFRKERQVYYAHCRVCHSKATNAYYHAYIKTGVRMRQARPPDQYCAYCGKKFYVEHWRLKKDYGKFCSRLCSYLARSNNPIERFWKHVSSPEDPEGCWLWNGLLSKYYGSFSHKPGSHISSHRYSWQIHYGSVPDGLYVLHKCDNKTCVRPDHLFLGTAKDNSQDMVQKNRQAVGIRNGAYTKPEQRRYGERNGNSKLSTEDVHKIWVLSQQKSLAHRLIAREFQVHRATISRILRREARLNG